MKFDIKVTGGNGGTLTLGNFGNVSLDQGALNKLLEKEMLNTRARLIADTQAGNQANGGPLKPYSRRYREMIDSGRIQGKAPGNHNVNLTATGVLLRSLQIQVVDSGARLYFEGRHPPTRYVSDAGAQKKRVAAKNKRHAMLLGSDIKPVRIKATKPGRKLTSLGSPRPTKPLKALKADAKRIRGDSTRGGKDQANAAIAQYQYDIGRTGWMSFSRSKDIPRIRAAVLKLINESAKKMIDRSR